MEKHSQRTYPQIECHRCQNHLNETEVRNLNEIGTMYLDYAERQARRGNVTYMTNWIKRLNAFCSSMRKIFCKIRGM